MACHRCELEIRSILLVNVDLDGPLGLLLRFWRLCNG